MKELVLDISKYDEGIDLAEWKQKRGLWGVIIKCGGNEGGRYKDRMFETHYANAKAAGVRVGAYWYSYASSESDAVQEANSIMSLLAGKQFEWPIYYDIEEKSIFSAGIASAIAKAFCRTLEANKFYCGVYSSASSLNSYFDDEVKTAFTIWVAHWDVDVPSYHGAYAVWQYHVGYTEGIDGQVDLDHGYIDFEPVMKEKGLNGY